MAKRVLITGASGFVGSNVLSYMLDKTDWKFVCICTWRHYGEPARIKPNLRVEVVTHDLIAPLPSLGSFDYILNLASESHVDRSILEPVKTVENNVSSTLQVLEYARKHRPTVFLQFSTDEVFGTVEHKEWDILLPSNPYAASKAAQEVVAHSYYRTYGLPVIITNSNNIVGPNQNPEKFVPKVAALLKAGKVADVHTIKGRPGRRWYNSVNNVSDALLYIIQQPFSELVRYSIPGGRLLDNEEMVRLIATKLGVEPKFRYLEAEKLRPGYDEFYAQADPIPGWEPPETLDEGLSWLT